MTADSIILDGGGITWTGGSTTTNVNRGISIGTNGGSINSGTTNTLILAQLISDVPSQSGVLTFGGAIAGVIATAVQNTFSGGLTLAGAMTFVPQASSLGPAGAPTSGPAGTGTLTFNGGQIRATTGSVSNLGNNVVFAANTTIPTSGLALTFSGATTLTGGTRTLTDNSANDVTFGGNIGDGGSGFGLIKAGTGKLIFAGANTYSGPTSIVAGTLTINSVANVGGGASALGAPVTAPNGIIAIGSGGTAVTLQFNLAAASTSDRVIDLAGTTGGVTLDAITANGAGAVTFTGGITASGAGSKTLTLTGTNTDFNTIGGPIVDNNTGGGFITTILKNGAGTWVLTGNNTGATGTTTATAGTLIVTAANSLPTGNVILNAGTFSVRSDANTTLTNAITMNSTTSTINVDQAIGGSGMNGVVTVPSITRLMAPATGTLNITGANGYSLSVGTLALPGGSGNDTFLAPTVPVVITGNVTNQMSAFSAANYDTLYLSGTSTGNSIGGVISDAVGGSIALGGYTRVIKQSGSTWSLLGAANTYVGFTQVNAGVLSVSTLANGGLPSSIGASTSAAANLSLGGGTLQYTGGTASTDRALTLTANSGIEITNPAAVLTIANTIAFSGGNRVLTKSGPGKLVMGGSADNTSTYLAVTEGQVDLDKSANGVRAVSSITGIALGATVRLTGSGTDQIYGGAAGANRGVQGLAGTLDLNSHTESISDFAGSATGVVTSTGAGLMTFTVGETNATANNFAGTIQDGAGRIVLAKIGSGTQILSGTNTYTGGTSVTAGTLQYDASSAISAVGRTVLFT